MGGGSCFLGKLDIFLFFKSFIFIFFFIWVRTSFPRIRYDQLMSLIWKNYLPISLSFILLVNSVLWGLYGLPPILWI
jgi:NADH:ubiquinone oxidoreductase subunit H